jgi:DNA-binding response OmpR family regulator
MGIGKVLVVEDDLELRRGLTVRLRKVGYEVVQAEDGLGAVSVAKREQPDVILLDIGLPGGDGFSVLERYAGFPDLSVIPVIVLTGRDPRAAEDAARRFGVAGFLSKPAENDELLAAIASAMEGDTAAPGTGTRGPLKEQAGPAARPSSTLTLADEVPGTA